MNGASFLQEMDLFDVKNRTVSGIFFLLIWGKILTNYQETHTHTPVHTNCGNVYRQATNQP